MQRSLAIAIFIMGLIECLILIAIALTPAPENATGLAHEVLPGVRIGGDGRERLAPIENLGYFFHVTVLVQVHLLIVLGVSEHKRSPLLFSLVGGCLAIALFIWWSLFTSYQNFLDSGTTEYFLGFPVASAWQVYALWVGGLSLVSLYVIGFERFIWSKEDERAFQEIVKQHSK